MSHTMNPVIWFEIPVADMARAKAFYESVFLMPLKDERLGDMVMASFPMNENEGGISGALVKHAQYLPSHDGALVYFFTADIQATLSRAKECAARVILKPTNTGRETIAIIEDSEGNYIGLHSPK